MSPLQNSHPSPAGKERFVFIDGLRGVAAVGVVFHHLYHNSEFHKPISEIAPAWCDWLLTFGARGVQIFFVLSGFVIAYSVRNMVMTRASAGNFILRRQIRLDPAYWVCLLFAVIDCYLMWRAHPQDVAAISVGQVLGNVAYLQGILHQTMFLRVSWTLCLEIQFYLLLIALLALCQRRPLSRGWIFPGLIFASACFSLAMRMTVAKDGDYPWFFGSWYLFGAGVLACWTFLGRVKPQFLLIMVALIGIGAIYKRDDGIAMGAIMVGGLFAVGRMNRLGSWLGNGAVQYFGRISYSLYLVHLTVLTRTYKMGMHLTGPGLGSALLWFVLAGIAAVMAAQVLHVVVERPTMRLAQSLKGGARRTRPVEAVSNGDVNLQSGGIMAEPEQVQA